MKYHADDDKLEVVCVLATDWCYYGDSSRDIRDKFEPIEGYIVGFMLEETEEKVVLAHQVFKESGLVRHVTVITKSSIVDMRRMRLKEDSEEEFDLEEFEEEE